MALIIYYGNSEPRKKPVEITNAIGQSPKHRKERA